MTTVTVTMGYLHAPEMAEAIKRLSLANEYEISVVSQKVLIQEVCECIEKRGGQMRQGLGPGSGPYDTTLIPSPARADGGER
jgi:hypothetical protein